MFTMDNSMQQWNIERVKPYDYVCSKHFVCGFGPTENHPYPLTADTYCKRQPTCRKRPKHHHDRSYTVRKKQKLQENEAAQALIELGQPISNHQTTYRTDDKGLEYTVHQCSNF